MKSLRISFLLAAVVLALAVPARAQVQSKAQQACLNKVVKTARKISGTVLKDVMTCIRKGAAGKLPGGETAQHCVGADLKGKVAKAELKLESAFTRSCGTPPDFGLVDAPTAYGAYEYDNRALAEDGFDDDLDAALLASSSVDPAGRCSATLPAGWRRVEDAMHRAVEFCLKAGLKAQTITGNTDIEACLDEMATDTKGRVGKAVDKLEVLLAKKCPAGDLSGVFPGLSSVCTPYLAGTDAAGIADCSEPRLRCRLCRIFDFAYGLDRDCDLFDDGNGGNASCPDCGNGVIDTGEGCDDANTVSGDGCSAFCVDEFCGDGVVNDNGAEQCDDGAGNSDTTPDACRLDCTDPYCGDGVTDTGEECDDGNTDENDGCTTQCTFCGNGIASGPEECDDGNTAAGDCCSPSCTFEAYGSICSGVPGGDCTGPGCDGAGSCIEVPANEASPCDDGDDCTNASECQSGTCTATSTVVTGAACNWAVVGLPTDGSGGARRVHLDQGATSSGNVCGDFLRLGPLSALTGEAVSMQGDAATSGIEIDVSTNVDAADVLTDLAQVEGLSGSDLPGLTVGTKTVAAGVHQAKDPAPTFYDTTGSDPRVGECDAAQLSLSTSTVALLDALSTDVALPATWASVGTGETRTATAVNVGGINVFDVTTITGDNNGITLEFDGGGDPNTVIILRVANKLETHIGWTFDLKNGLTPDHFLIYGKGTNNTDCYIGQDNVGAGTIFCPDARVDLVLNTQWTGSLFGGGTSAFAVHVGQNVMFTHQRFTGL